MRYSLLWIAFWVLASSCGTSKTVVKSNDRTGNEPTLVGKWIMSKIEMPGLDSMTKAGKPEFERKNAEEKIDRMKSMIVGGTLEFNSNNSYQSLLGGKSSAGSWQFVTKTGILVLSPNDSKMADTISIISRTMDEFTAKKDIQGMDMIMTANRKR